MDTIPEFQFVPQLHAVEGEEGFLVLGIKDASNHSSPGPGYTVIANAVMVEFGTPHPYIHSLYVSEQFRRRGVGTAMLLACRDKADAAKKKSLTLWVGKKNEAAVAMYLKAGMSEVHCSDAAQLMLVFILNKWKV